MSALAKIRAPIESSPFFVFLFPFSFCPLPSRADFALMNIEQAFADLFQWCRSRNFAGYDPFDALNSRVFQSTPLRHSRSARLLWTQLSKRSPVNLRALAGVPPQTNSKGLALFALAALAHYRRMKTAETETEARALLTKLMESRIEGYSGAAWGYNFAWQSRNFYAPEGTPMIVPTAFAVRALIEASQTLDGSENGSNEGRSPAARSGGKSSSQPGALLQALDPYLELARSSCNFIRNDLNRTVESETEICFSYSPLDQTRIYNASLLAAETLTSVGALTGETEPCDLAIRAARYVVRAQREDGSWGYGAGPGQEWVDNFHSAYVLVSLARIRKQCQGNGAELDQALQRGVAFWRERFFLADGWPKYYHDSLYPADAHSAATAIITLLELQDLDPGALELAGRIADWTLRNLRDRQGFFYYQRQRFYTRRTPYMRWTQAWMLYALARLLEEKVAVASLK